MQKFKFPQNMKLQIDPSSNGLGVPKIIPSPYPRLFALLIGIDFYQNVRSLRSAAADALSFKETLESHLGVPPNQIQTLLNRSASRSAILDALRRFESDCRIQRGDPILVFYAGHGSEIAMTETGSDSKIQVIVPQDYCSEPGKEIPPIPDRTIGALLSNIADAKGDNITVVFDCCHAASGTRGSESEDPCVRSVTLAPTPINQHLDHEIWGSRSVAIPKNFQHAGLRSHVLIAACSSTETSREANGHGLFSSAFLRLLHTRSPEKLKYSEILKHMDVIPGQNPQCEGVNQTRALFDSKVVALQRVYFDMASNEKGDLIVAAGAVHGIAQDAEFTVFKNADSLHNNPIGVFKVDSLSPFSSIIRRPLSLEAAEIGQVAVALQTKAGRKEDIRLYIPPNEAMTICFEAWLSLMKGGDFQQILLVETPEDAHLELALEDENITFIYRDPKFTQYGLSRVFSGVEPQLHELTRALKSIAHFFWKLELTNNNPEVMSAVEFHFNRLDQSEYRCDDLSYLQTMSPIGPNLHQRGVIDFVVDDEPYGIRLVNTSKYDFYPYLFYFDASDLSISSYYESPSTGSYALEVPLKANGGTLTIGYGTGGASPFSYYLRYPQNVDVGFLKLFLSTRPINLSNISQPTPFEDGRGASNISKDKEETWGTITIPVVQRRYPLNTETHCVQCGSISAKSLDLNQKTVIQDLEYQRDVLMKELDILRQNIVAERTSHDKIVMELKSKLQSIEDSHAADAGLAHTRDNMHEGQDTSRFQERENDISQTSEKRRGSHFSALSKKGWPLRFKQLVQRRWK